MNNSNKITILYVDDEPINTFLFNSIFNKRFEVITGISAREGLEKINIAGNTIDIVISDFLMPEMNGVEFIQIAKSKYPNINYYILSAYEKNKDIIEALESNLIEYYFRKPIKAKEIEEVLAQRIKK